MVLSYIILLTFPSIVFNMVMDRDSTEPWDALESSADSVSDVRKSNYGVRANALESSDFFSDIVSPSGYRTRNFEPSDYDSLFETFPKLPYFPDFGEIFRIQKTTTPKPPFGFPDYVRDPFQDRTPDHLQSDRVRIGGDSRTTVAGGRRPSRRPPRPASSGTKAKLLKQSDGPKEKTTKPTKTKTSTAKSRDYPKIFRFTADRVNLADFDRHKKSNGNYESLTKGDELDSDNVKRSKFLILHGGVFELDRAASNGLFASGSEHRPVFSENDSESTPTSLVEGDGT